MTNLGLALRSNRLRRNQNPLPLFGLSAFQSEVQIEQNPRGIQKLGCIFSIGVRNSFPRCDVGRSLFSSLLDDRGGDIPLPPGVTFD
jgi:hypothetical protein